MNDKTETKAPPAPTAEDKLRKAATDFVAAMAAAQDEGYDFAWPANAAAMNELAISQGAKPSATKKAR